MREVFSVKRLVKGKKWALRLYGELSENRADGIIRHETLM